MVYSEVIGGHSGGLYLSHQLSQRKSHHPSPPHHEGQKPIYLRGVPADGSGLGTGTRDEMGWTSEITYFLISEPGQRVFFGLLGGWGIGGV